MFNKSPEKVSSLVQQALSGIVSANIFEMCKLDGVVSEKRHTHRALQMTTDCIITSNLEAVSVELIWITQLR
jgi:hypothetical protein